jgi:uncharacterized membrane protein
MIECHVFNSFTRTDLYGTSSYILSQFIGGMAAPLFLLLAGMTFAFLFEKLDRNNAPIAERLKVLLKRGGYVLMLAYLFRLSNALSKWPGPELDTIWKVDILNCMGVSMIALSLITFAPPRMRAQIACLAGLAIASASPLVSHMDWSGVLPQIKEYFVPNRIRFPLFPWSAYVAFGIAAGVVVRRTPAERLERTVQWGSLVGFGMILGGQYFSNLPFAFYEKVEFWTDSPSLVMIRTGLCLLTLAGGYVWTEYLVSPGPGWVQVFGHHSLMVYWVHVILVYGALSGVWGSKLSIGQSAAAVALIVVLMIALCYARLGERFSPHFSRLLLAKRS